MILSHTDRALCSGTFKPISSHLIAGIFVVKYSSSCFCHYQSMYAGLLLSFMGNQAKPLGLMMAEDDVTKLEVIGSPITLILC